MRIFFDVDGVLIHGWHAKPERRRPWDATLQQDLGVDPLILRDLLFEPRDSLAAPYHALASKLRSNARTADADCTIATTSRSERSAP